MNVKAMLLIISLHFFAGHILAQHGISANGKYVFVTEDKTQNYSGSTLLLQSTDGKWKKEIRKGNNASFTADGKMIVYRSGDTLCIQQTGSDKISYLAPVTSYKISAGGRLAAWSLQGEKSLRVLQLPSGKETSIAGVSLFDFAPDGTLYYVMKEGDQNKLYRYAAATPPQEIWSGKSQVLYQGPDKTGSRLVFVVSNPSGNSIWQYQNGKGAATCLVKDGMKELGDSLVLSTESLIGQPMIGVMPCMITERGTKLLFYTREKYKVKLPEKGVDLWSYTDVKPMDWQLRDAAIPMIYAYAADLNTGKIIRLEQNDAEKLPANYGMQVSNPLISDEYTIVFSFPGQAFTFYNNGTIISSYSILENAIPWLVNLQDGKRVRIKDQVRHAGIARDLPFYQLSPNNDFILFFDQEHFFSYHISTAQTRNITANLPSRFSGTIGGISSGILGQTNFVGWMGEHVLIQDSDGDLWKIPLHENGSAVCLTNRFFKNLNAKEPVRTFYINPVQPMKDYAGMSSLLCQVTADRYTSQGYYNIALDKAAAPAALVPLGEAYRIDQFLKAAEAPVYLISRQSATLPSHTVLTRDFKNFTPCTGSAREERPPGITLDIIRWTMYDGKPGQGLLLKPRDFDPNKKYPVVVTYYETNHIWHNIYSHYNTGHLVDHGYLVFSPDIYFSIGETGKNVLNAVVSGAEHIAQLPYVDAKHMGLFGGSFGGFSTNYLLTHSNLFAAAISIAGYSDYIGNKGIQDYGRRPHESHSGAGSQNRMGLSLWERPDVYIANSSVFYADRVTTPVLFFHNRGDDNVPFEQSVSLFRALRSLGKRAWLVQYDGEGHMAVSSPNVGYEKDGGDFTIRRIQFFNHYLQGAPAPMWMLQGTPARLKGKWTGFELDSTGRTPGEGLPWLNGYERSPVQKELLKYRTRVTDDGRVVEY